MNVSFVESADNPLNKDANFYLVQAHVFIATQVSVAKETAAGACALL